MIIGNGMIAKAFSYYENINDVMIFASGVSNSNELNNDQYKREENLLNEIIYNNPEKTLVYFSTCSIYDDSVNSSTYVVHKKKMEELIIKSHSKFYIFRLPQVVGETKSPTLVNFLFSSILNNKTISINKNSTRNLIDVEDVFKIASFLINNKIYQNEITNIATPNNEFVLNILLMIKKITNLEVNYDIQDFGFPYSINIDKIKNLNIDSDIFDSKYSYKVLYKYFINYRLAESE